MIKLQITTKILLDFITKTVQVILNTSLAILALIITCLLVKELMGFGELIREENLGYNVFLERILVFFIYFEFISMIVKYFKEDYHFPMRYFLYIGITAMIRLIIVEHEDPMKTLVNALVILVLIIGYFVMNITPSNRPEHWQDLQKQSIKVSEGNNKI